MTHYTDVHMLCLNANESMQFGMHFETRASFSIFQTVIHAICRVCLTSGGVCEHGDGLNPPKFQSAPRSLRR